MKQPKKSIKNSVIPLVINNIISLRNQRGYSQEYMAQEMNISTQSYGNIERQVTQLSAIHIELIAHVLNVEPYKLWCNNMTPRNEHTNPLHQEALSPIDQLTQQINQLTQQNEILINLLKKHQTE